MAKKVVATLKTGKGKDFSKVITFEKSEKTGAYAYREMIVHSDHAKEYLDSRKQD